MSGPRNISPTPKALRTHPALPRVGSFQKPLASRCVGVSVFMHVETVLEFAVRAPERFFVVMPQIATLLPQGGPNKQKMLVASALSPSQTSPVQKARAEVEAAPARVAVHHAIVVDGAIHAKAKVGAETQKPAST